MWDHGLKLPAKMEKGRDCFNARLPIAGITLAFILFSDFLPDL